MYYTLGTCYQLLGDTLKSTVCFKKTMQETEVIPYNALYYNISGIIDNSAKTKEEYLALIKCLKKQIETSEGEEKIFSMLKLASVMVEIENYELAIKVSIKIILKRNMKQYYK